VHQHSPEINQVLSKVSGKKVEVVFVRIFYPLSGDTLNYYLKKAPGAKLKVKSLTDLYKKFYKNEPFIRIKPDGTFPGSKM